LEITFNFQIQISSTINYFFNCDHDRPQNHGCCRGRSLCLPCPCCDVCPNEGNHRGLPLHKPAADSIKPGVHIRAIPRAYFLVSHSST
jgi:hypothetical protein